MTLYTTSHISQFLQMLVLFAVLLVDREECSYSLVESLSRVRRAIFCILFLLEQNQVVDFVVVEHRLASTCVPNVLYFEFFQVVATYEWSSKAILSCSIICSSVHPMSDKEFRYLSSLCHLSSMVFSSMLGLTSFLQHFLSLVVDVVVFPVQLLGALR